jgi:hypothetical protein
MVTGGGLNSSMSLHSLNKNATRTGGVPQSAQFSRQEFKRSI